MHRSVSRCLHKVTAMYCYLLSGKLHVAMVTVPGLDVGILHSCQSDIAGGSLAGSASRVGICLSRCSLRVKDFPQWVHQMVFSVDVDPAGIVSTASVTRLRLSTSGRHDGSCGWPTLRSRTGSSSMREGVSREAVLAAASCKRRPDVESGRRGCCVEVI